jgi:hypothetical protein
MLRIVAAVQKFMTELNGALSEEEKIVAIINIVSNLMKESSHHLFQAYEVLHQRQGIQS